MRPATRRKQNSPPTDAFFNASRCSICGGNTSSRQPQKGDVDCYCDPEDLIEEIEDEIMDREEPGQMLTDEFW